MIVAETSCLDSKVCRITQCRDFGTALTGSVEHVDTRVLVLLRELLERVVLIRRFAESPNAETLGTAGTGPVEHVGSVQHVDTRVLVLL